MNIFENKEEMPLKENDPIAVRVALTPAEMYKNHTPALIPNRDASVQNNEPRRRGHGY
jgi:hypothetical protein